MSTEEQMREIANNAVREMFPHGNRFTISREVLVDVVTQCAIARLPHIVKDSPGHEGAKNNG